MEESLRERQKKELYKLQSIYRDDFILQQAEVESKENKSASKEEDDGSEPAEPRREISDLLPDELIQFRLHLTPPLGMVDSADMQVTVDSADMQVTLPAEYPRCGPKVLLINSRGAPRHDLSDIERELAELVVSSLGEEMMYTLAQHVQKRLVGYNTPQMVVSQQTKQRREEEERERQMKEKREAEQRRSEYEQHGKNLQVSSERPRTPRPARSKSINTEDATVFEPGTATPPRPRSRSPSPSPGAPSEQLLRSAIRRSSAQQALQGSSRIPLSSVATTGFPSTPSLSSPGVSNDSIARLGHRSRLRAEFEIQQRLGKGAFGDVLKVRNKLDGCSYAIKRIPLEDSTTEVNSKIIREVKLLSRLNHKNIVRYYNSWIECPNANEIPCELLGDDDGFDDDEVGDSEEENLRGAMIPEDSYEWSPHNSPKTGNSPMSHHSSKAGASAVNSTPRHSRRSSPPSGPKLFQVPSDSSADDDEASTDDNDDDDDDEEESFAEDSSRYYSAGDLDDRIQFQEMVEFEGRPGPTEAGVFDMDDSDDGGIQFKTSPSPSDDENKADKKAKEAVKVNVEEVLDDGPEKPPMQFLCIQMEFCEQGTLRDVIDKQSLYQDENRVWRLFRELVKGIAHIHSRQMIHRDLKPQNIFLDIYDHIKIGDFGLATARSYILRQTSFMVIHSDGNSPVLEDWSRSAGSSQSSCVGTALYISPELRGLSKYSQKVDIYSLGIIFFEMWNPPLTTGMERINVLSGLRSELITFPENFDVLSKEKQIKLIRWMLKHDPALRPTARELLDHDCLPLAMEEHEMKELNRNKRGSVKARLARISISKQALNRNKRGSVKARLARRSISKLAVKMLEQMSYPLEPDKAAEFLEPLKRVKGNNATMVEEGLSDLNKVISHLKGVGIKLPVPLSELVEYLLSKRENYESPYSSRMAQYNPGADAASSTSSSTPSGGVPPVSVTVMPAESGKLPAHIKRKYQTQALIKVTPLAHKLGIRPPMGLLALELSKSVLQEIRSAMDLSVDEDEFAEQVAQLRSQLPKHRRYLNRIFDNIQGLVYVKKVTVIFLYSCKDEYCEMIL